MRIPLNVNTFTDLEENAAINTLKSGYVTQGFQVEQFEREVANFVGARYAVMVNSGSSANLLLWKAIATFSGWKDYLAPEVIVPAIGWSTTIWPLLQTGLKPVIVDVDPHTFQMSLSAMKAALTSRTKAVYAVHVLGNMADMEQVKLFTEANSLILVEDACEAFGSTFKGVSAGTWGYAGTYSFYFSHQITTIEGGMIVTNSGLLADCLRMMRSHGWSRSSTDHKKFERQYHHRGLDPNFLFLTEGFNMRSTDVNAAIGRVQLSRFPELNRQRKSIRSRWLNALADTSLSPMVETPDLFMAPFGFPVICQSKEERNGLQTHLAQAGIETRSIVSGNIARHPAFDDVLHDVCPLPNADAITDKGLMWGLHTGLNETDIEYVEDTIWSFENLEF